MDNFISVINRLNLLQQNHFRLQRRYPKNLFIFIEKKCPSFVWVVVFSKLFFHIVSHVFQIYFFTTEIEIFLQCCAKEFLFIHAFALFVYLGP